MTAQLADSAAGTLPDAVYDSQLHWWRAAVRRILVRTVERESRWIASLQQAVRTPLLDTYFVYTSSLGTHTFFMTALPLFFFFGRAEMGRAVVFVLAAGVYTTSFIKDLLCSPRPYVPPVTRLSMGSHHLEYGFPSTHTTNSVSIAVYLLLCLLASPLSSQPHFFYPSLVALFLYASSIVFGRIYCGMHSATDCIFGTLLGCSISIFWWQFGPFLENAFIQASWIAPLTLVAAWMLVIKQHPQPVDDCPCFEDAIAFTSVQAGITLSLWHARHFGLDHATGFFVATMPGITVSPTTGVSTITSVPLYLSIAAIKIIMGILAIFVFRLVAKGTLQTLLPPVFRFLAQCFDLPNRRWYTPATEYSGSAVPSTAGDTGSLGLGAIRAIPSVIDLPSSANVIKDESVGGSALFKSLAAEGLKRRTRSDVEGEGEDSEKDRESFERVQMTNGKHDSSVHEGVDGVRHYDADVLTRAGVYCGIGILVTEVIPVTFELVGWGL